MCSQLQFFYLLYRLVDPTENDFMQSAINKELLGPVGTNNPRQFSKTNEIALISFV